MTIKITYDHECDGCKKIIMTENYNWAHFTIYTAPQPQRGNAFVLFGINADLCSECAAPLLEAKEQMMKNIIKARGAA
jgi:NAD-dependent dihydropyrimidine dehydrogenase PreA subunit